MSKCHAAPSYLIPDILQFVLNEYIEHTDISKYNNTLNFKFDTKKYIEQKLTHYANGNISEEKMFIDDELMYIMGYYKNGNLRVNINFKTNSRDYREYFEDGSENFREHTINGELEGKQYDSYKNGVKKYVHNYKNGIKEGKQYEYYENGSKKSEYEYINGLKEGFQYEYSKKGKTLAIEYRENNIVSMKTDQ
jgi:antitoxin component YwqK of YwqJK toxin-antitoxin module